MSTCGGSEDLGSVRRVGGWRAFGMSACGGSVDAPARRHVLFEVWR